MKKILIVDYQLSSCELLRKFLTKKNFEVETTTHGEKALLLIQKIAFDVVICDYRLPDFDGTEFFNKASVIQPQSAYIFISNEVNLRNAVSLVRRGAYSYLAKPLNPDELLEVIREAISIKNSISENNDKSSEVGANEMKFVVGKSELSREMIKQVKRVGPTNYSVIIEGETGTGKESLARMIHNESPRRNMPFIAIDCGSISKEISGSELFGHEKGSFTGAISQKTGFFELAEGGTIFLDEIANLSLETQMALLRALQEKVIRKIGGIKEIPVDVRIIAATNEDLRSKSETSGFRDDLFFRLSEFVLKVPALRDRKVDLPLFIDFFLECTARELGRPKPELSQEVIDHFQTYTWPGNIRELKNVIRRASLFVSKDNYIYLNALPSSILANEHAHFQELSLSNERKETQLNGNFDEYTDLKSTAIHAESKKIIEVLNKVHFNKTKAAEILNIHRKTLYTKLKMMNIQY
ncbi:sigma-54-dependent Fis family transcriptional regulator [Marivirga sp. S37H4]|uniref:Sigma-54-dependent Fis family transcriptional regulator n=1 Tax=Marivirga aurantiaca TaxID=2802615 RepID=A0A934WWB0_9BACT|nr:sigma-54 dependent transcriptional regulator [Marivirga aurantiaca]MBK6264076.1 sigma-54-dependent Fis family transcriptional regulator [Marivirga aurantiaca]